MTYKEASAQACEGCREDWFIIGRTHWGKDDETLTCTAPKRDEHEAGLLARIAELEADKRRLDWLQKQREDSAWSHFEICADGSMDRYYAPGSADWTDGKSGYFGDIRAAFDAAMKATK